MNSLSTALRLKTDETGTSKTLSRRRTCLASQRKSRRVFCPSLGLSSESSNLRLQMKHSSLTKTSSSRSGPPMCSLTSVKRMATLIKCSLTVWTPTKTKIWCLNQANHKVNQDRSFSSRKTRNSSSKQWLNLISTPCKESWKATSREYLSRLSAFSQEFTESTQLRWKIKSLSNWSLWETLWPTAVRLKVSSIWKDPWLTGAVKSLQRVSSPHLRSRTRICWSWTLRGCGLTSGRRIKSRSLLPWDKTLSCCKGST